MPMMASQISTFVDFTKIQKFRYFEKETLSFLQIKKKSLITHQELLYGKKYGVATFKLTLKFLDQINTKRVFPN